MASSEDVIEPLAVSTVAPILSRWRSPQDLIRLNQDKLDGFMSRKEGHHFMVVHRLPEIKEQGRPYLIPGVPITCRVDNTERHTTRSKVKVSTLYTLELKHGPFFWTVKRKYKHFQELNHDIYKHKMMYQWNPLGKFSKERQQMRLMTEEMPSLHGSDRSKRTSSKMKYLEEYLNNLLEIEFCRNDHSMMEFLSISALSFVADLGPKGLEGPIYKRSGGHHIQGLNCFGHHRFCFSWSHRWLVVKDSFLIYMSRDHSQINFVLLFDPQFEVKVGHSNTDIRDGVCLENSTRSLVIKCNNFRQSLWWSSQINEIKNACEFCKKQKHGGFFGPRENTLTKWYVNGRDYFSDLADALEQAKEEIFITDWWLSPEIFLKRPATDNHWRLDELLKRKAKQGVKVCVLLYKEVEVALGINSEHSKRTLMDLDPNIKVMRHPDHLSSVVLLWAHHEKTVAIDQTVAFVGGIDLAFGRWDDSQYRLTDLGLANSENQEQPGADVQDTGAADDPLLVNSKNQEPLDLSRNTKLWLGKDYSNFIKKDWTQLDKPFEDNVDRSEVPRMPWRDLSAAVHGKAAKDVARHFIQRWNFTKIFKNKYKDDFYPYLLPKSHSTEDPLSYIVPGSKKAKVQVLRSTDSWSTGTCENSILEAYIQTIKNSQHYIYIENQFFISCAGDNVQNTIGDAIVDRILLAHREQKKYRVFVVIPLLPGFEGDLTTKNANAIQTILHFTYRTICRGEQSILHRLSELKDQWTEYITFCGLRTHSQLSQKLVTELIYVHSKTLIADDRCYIIGSANINDRSMLGSRDSEVAVLVEDEEMVPSIMGGEPYQAGLLTLALRKECFSVLVGATSDPSINIDDPISDDFFYLTWNETAKLNASIYDKVFRCLPCNSVYNKRVLKEYSSQDPLCDTDCEQAAEELKAIRGLLVHFPLMFLYGENLLPPLNTKEGMAPVEMWT
ncbi:Phospholipase D2 [Oryzias melastigma]|uniref:Phospholipase n=1 Tax=Oryzias melastigma TaxID=30732 RepID=A0A834FEX5_ORYME|nr:Phospholipase D2 [Oryzias melastigma]